MSDRICICGKEFRYPYLLLRHQNSMHCGIISHSFTMSNRDKNSKIKNFLCLNCNNSFASKFSLERHQVKCNLQNTKDKQNIEQNPDSNNYLVKQLEDTKKQLEETNKERRYYMELYIKNIKEMYDKKVAELNKNNEDVKKELTLENILKQHSENNSNNNFENNSENKNVINMKDSNLVIGDQTTNNNNGTINNITINNNIQNTVHVVYPFGYENISFLTDEEILEILKSSEGASMVLDKIYSNIENNNFMKFSKKEKTMSYIASPKDIKYCNDEQFITMLYEQAKTLLDRIFFQCYPNLSNEHQLIVWDNVRTIKESLSNKSGNLKDSCINIITSKVNNSEEKRIYKEIKDKLNIKDKIQIDKIEEVKKNIEIELYELEKNMITKNLNLIKLKEEIWGDIMSDESMDFEQYENDLRLLRYINTYRYNKIKELNKLEYDSILAIEKLTIGDLESIIDMRNARNQNELQTVMMKNQELPKEYIDEIQNTLIDKPKNDNTINLSSVRLKNRNRHRRLKNSNVHVPLITN